MARIEIEEFSGKEISRIFIARSIREADKVERLLEENGISYAVQIEEFVSSGLLTVSTRKGAACYVSSSHHDFCRDLFFKNNLKKGWIDETD